MKLTPRTIRAKRSTTLRFSLSRGARVTLTVQMRRGRSRYVTLKGRRLITGKAGSNNRVAITRKFAGKNLKAGSYRLVLTVAGGSASRLTFVVRAR